MTANELGKRRVQNRSERVYEQKAIPTATTAGMWILPSSAGAPRARDWMENATRTIETDPIDSE